MENFILFDESSGEPRKILARNHQFLGVNRAIEAVRDRRQRQGKLGVFWHTQGAGKSYSIVMFTRKVHRKLGGNFTFLVLTDRDDLDTQIYKTFAGCGVVDHDKEPCRASSGDHLSRLLSEHKAYIFSLIQKFNQNVDPAAGYTLRDDIIVITDEAHRTQYGTLALNMRNALPNASYIGFTGTPLFKDDEITRRVFGAYVSTYDFQRAVVDKATVPLYYDARGEKLGVAIGDLNDRIAQKLEELESQVTADIDVAQRLERELKRDYHVITADKRLDQVARDFVQHYSTAWETGKAMLVCIDKVTCVQDARPDHQVLGRAHHGTGGEAAAGGRRAGGNLPPTADQLDAGDAGRGGRQRGAGRGREVPEMGPGHQAAPEAHQGRHGPAGIHAAEAAVPQHAAHGAGRRVQGGGTPLPHRHRVRHVADRVRRAEPVHAVPGQAAQGPHPDAGHRPRQPGQRGQEQRPDRGLLRDSQAPAEGAGHLRRHAARRGRRRDRSRQTG